MTAAAYNSGAALFRERALAVARMGWVVFCAVAVATFLAALPVRWVHLSRPAPLTLANLQAIGLPVSVYAVYLISLEVVFAGVYIALGSLIYLRRANEGIGLLVAYWLVAYGVGNQTITPVIEALRGIHPALDFLLNTHAYIAWVGLGLFFYLFPDGRFVPAWAGWPALLWALFCIPYNYAMGTPFYPPNWPTWLGIPLILSSWVLWLYSQVYRYRRVSGPIERQQTKWVTFGLALIVAVVLAEVAAVVLFPERAIGGWLLGAEPPTPESLAAFLAWLGVVRVSFLLLPIALVFSILRYRLWDIDRLINRALVYGLLTGSLVLVYFGSVVILQGLFDVLAGGAAQTPLIVVASTLAIAALFAPLRRRLQDFIDRRFYRRRYNAAQTLAAFGAVARDETDLDRLAGRLVTAINETVQPRQATLWLKPPAAGEKLRRIR